MIEEETVEIYGGGHQILIGGIVQQGDEAIHSFQVAIIICLLELRGVVIAEILSHGRNDIDRIIAAVCAEVKVTYYFPKSFLAEWMTLSPTTFFTIFFPSLIAFCLSVGLTRLSIISKASLSF